MLLGSDARPPPRMSAAPIPGVTLNSLSTSSIGIARCAGDNENVIALLAAVGGALLGLVVILRGVSGVLVARSQFGSNQQGKTWPYVLTLVVLGGGAMLVLVVVSLASHAVYRLGADYVQGLGFTASAVADVSTTRRERRRPDLSCPMTLLRDERVRVVTVGRRVGSSPRH